MKLFHVGMRVDEIVCLNSSGSDEYPTSATLRSGVKLRVTGTWRENVDAVESIIESNRIEEHDRQLALTLASDLYTIGVLSRFARSGRKQMRAQELEAIRSIFGGEA